MKVKTYITKKQRKDQDVVAAAFENFTTGTLTTEHSASSYGQPVILEEGKLLDYSKIQSITLPYGSSNDALAAARRLECFGILVSRESVPPSI